MDQSRVVSYAPQSYASVESAGSLKASPSRKRKSRGLGAVLRKLFGRKSIKSEISLPTSPRHIQHAPQSFVTASSEDRSKRVASLPIGEISRHSALGSHAPSEILPQEKELEADPPIERRPRRPRRATLPSIVGSTPEPFTEPADIEKRRGTLGNGQTIDPENIGYAVTSGSNPKRRSRSADAYYNAARSHQMSPVPWRQDRRRSDEIRYWRASVSPPTRDTHLEGGQDYTAKINEAVPKERNSSEQQNAPDNFFHHDDDDDDDADDEEDQTMGQEQQPEPPDENRDTFDFGVLAATIQKEENIPMEERMITVEIKLMDLEYAISKLQANNVQDTAPAPINSSPNPQKSDAETEIRSHPGRASPVSANKSHIGSETTSGSVSTQPTNTSFMSPPPHSQPSGEDPFVESKNRPTSTATMIHSHRHVVSPIPSERNSSTVDKHNSLTNMTIDHFSSLIGLIRREQAARHRLEDQVVELQREIKALKQQYSPLSANFPRPRGWVGPRSEASFRNFEVSQQMPSYDDTTSTEDGYQDAYQTPIEQPRRGEYEGGVFVGGVEGEAF